MVDSATATMTTELSAEDQKAKEAYFTAGQMELVWTRFKRNRSAMWGARVLMSLILMGLFAPSLSPYDPSIAGRDATYQNGAPQIPKFWDENGFSFRPFIYTYSRSRSAASNFRWVTEIDRDKRRYVQFFVSGWDYHFIDFGLDMPGKALDFSFRLFKSNTHLFGVSEGGIHLFGTEKAGKDIFARTLHAIYTSLAVGTIGVFISFVLALVIGGVSGYFGGKLDGVIQMITDAVRTIPTIPLFMALAAFVPNEWSAEMRFFFISVILGLVGWPTLARRVRTHLLTERSQEYVLAAELCGASAGHVIRRHLLPSFTSYIIVDLVISFPYMVLSETALSFIGLGLKDPVNSLGVMLQNVTKADVLLNYQWYFIPVLFFMALVLAFVFVGDGLRDAADPYSDHKIMTEPLIKVENLTLQFKTDEGLITAVDNVSFEVAPGEIMGLVGESGSGKSVTAKSLMQLNPGNAVYSPESRVTLTTNGNSVDVFSLKSSRDLRVIRGGMISMIFQEPMASFAPAISIGKHMTEQLLIHSDMTEKEATVLSIEMLERVGISEAAKRFKQYAFELSGGMRQRAMIAMALSTKPKLLIADEPTTALDVTIQAQVLDLMKDLVTEYGMGIIFITHDLGVIAQTADKVAVMYLGGLVEQGPVRDVIRTAEHPYTKGLLNALPKLDDLDAPLTPVAGDIPSPLERPSGCVFHPRCPEVIMGRCDVDHPSFSKMNEHHEVSCFAAEDKGARVA